MMALNYVFGRSESQTHAPTRSARALEVGSSTSQFLMRERVPPYATTTRTQCVSETCSGYEDTFIDPTDDLTCLICQLVARDAHQMSCCGKVVCSSCIRKWKRQNTGNNSCIHCQQSAGENFPDPRTQNQIKELRVSCKNEAYGCDWSGKLRDKQTHQRSCESRSIPCPNGCLEKVIHRNLNYHQQNECPKRRHECHICKQSGVYDDMVEHPSVCPRVQISCPNSCGEEMLRFQLAAHRATCPKEVLKCPYSSTGCRISVLREGLAMHVGENISQHLSLAVMRITELEKRLEEAEVRSPPVTFQMPGCSRLPINQPWYSPPFYTTGNGSGYKMCLGVCSREEIGSGVSVTVTVYLMQGQNDDKLIWPFKGEVKIELLNQFADEQHHSNTVKFADETLKEFNSRVTVGERCTVGLSYDISQDDLESDDMINIATYLENDYIYFRVSQVKVHSLCKPWLVPSLFPTH